ncbi:uncharacterized protein TNCV_2973481 [Trichonephila clavipes]|nr:uncharacterized protein TNCV_2973481 [Trichonephila clavipes]
MHQADIARIVRLLSLRILDSQHMELESEKDFNGDHRVEFTDFLPSIPGFQECDEVVETWMACDAEDCGFQMLNDDEILTSVQEESDPVDNETNEDEDNNNNESSKGPSKADEFSALETAMEWYEHSECCPTQLLLLKRIGDLAAKKRRCTMIERKINDIFHNKGKIVTFCTYFAFSSSTFPACVDFQYSYYVRFHILHESHSVFGYPNNRVFERCPVPIDSDKRCSVAHTRECPRGPDAPHSP